MFHLSRKWMRCSSEVIWFFFQPPFFCHLPCNNTTVGILHLKHGSWDDKCSNDSVNSFPWNFLKEYQYISNIRDYSVPWTVPKMCHQRCGTAKQAAGTSPSWRTRWPARRSASQHFFGQSRACLLRRHLKRYDVQALKRSGEKGRCWADDWNLGRVTTLIELWQTSWSRIKVYIPGTQMTFKVDIYLNQSAFPNAWLCWTKKTWWPNMEQGSHAYRVREAYLLQPHQAIHFLLSAASMAIKEGSTTYICMYFRSV